MGMPGFTAEASLYRSSERYSAAIARERSSDAGEAVQAAGIFDIILDPCSYCFSNCARQLKSPSSGRDCLNACHFAGLC
jgi:hypothetical protein